MYQDKINHMALQIVVLSKKEREEIKIPQYCTGIKFNKETYIFYFNDIELINILNNIMLPQKRKNIFERFWRNII